MTIKREFECCDKNREQINQFVSGRRPTQRNESCKYLGLRIPEYNMRMYEVIAFSLTVVSVMQYGFCILLVSTKKPALRKISIVYDAVIHMQAFVIKGWSSCTSASPCGRAGRDTIGTSYTPAYFNIFSNTMFVVSSTLNSRNTQVLHAQVT